MKYLKYLLTSLLLLAAIPQVQAQSEEWKLMRRANAAFNAHRISQAQALYMQVLKRNPQNARATFNLADTYLSRGDVRLADSLFDKASQMERNPQVKSMSFHNRGYIRQRSALTDQENQQQLLRQAIELYKQALRLNPHDEDTRYNLVLCQRQLRNSPDNKQKQNPQQKQQQKQKQDQQRQQQQRQQQQQQAREDKNRQNKQQTEQYINLSKQAERNARQRINNSQPRQKSLDKNW